MPQYTQNYSYAEPQYGEQADIEVLNQYVTAKVDENIYQTRRMMVDGYDSTATYNTGDLVEYSNALYKCLADNVTGTWDSTKWELTTLADSAGGSSSLSDLDDVDITTPADGDILIYDDTDDEWKNEPLPDVSVTKEASGNPITFSDGADAPLVKCVSEIQGSQDLHGYDKPWVGGAGVNKMPPLTNGTYTSNGLTATVTDNSITVTGQFTTTQATWVDIPFVSAVTIPSGYYLHVRNSEIHNFTVLDFDSQANILLNEQNRIVSISALTSCTKIRFYCSANATEQFNLTMQLSIEQADSVTDWTPYSNICPITAYTEGEIEVRGKNLFDGVNLSYWINGTGTSAGRSTGDSGGIVDVSAYEKVTVSTTIAQARYRLAFISAPVAMNASTTAVNGVSLDTQSTSYTMTVPSDAKYLVINATDLSKIQVEKGTSPTTYEPYTSTTHTTTYPSAIYRGSEDVVNGSVTSEMVLCDLSDITWSYNSNYDLWVSNGVPNGYKAGSFLVAELYPYVPTLQTTGTEYGIRGNQNYNLWCRNYDSVNAPSGMLAYELATPTTSSVTPTNLPIRTLSGYNHIESSTGDMEIEYITEGYQPLVDLIQSNTSIDVYSTTPQKVGKWFNNEDVYEVCVRASQTAGGYQQVDTGISTDAKAWIVEGYAISLSTATDIYSSPIDAYYSSPAPLSLLASLYKNTTSNHWNVTYRIGSELIGGEAFFKIRYVTESTTLTRSLSLSKGETSEEKKELEEEPIEEKKSLKSEITEEETKEEETEPEEEENED